MAVNLKSNLDGTSGAIQVNGVDAITFNSSGLQTGVILDNKTFASPTNTGVIYDNGSVRSNIVDLGGGLNIDCSLGNYFIKTINGASTFTVSNVPTSRAYAFTLELTHTSGAITWFSGVEWPNATPPDLITGRTHVFVFLTDNGGTRWRAAVNPNYNN